MTSAHRAYPRGRSDGRLASQAYTIRATGGEVTQSDHVLRCRSQRVKLIMTLTESAEWGGPLVTPSGRSEGRSAGQPGASTVNEVDLGHEVDHGFRHIILGTGERVGY